MGIAELKNRLNNDVAVSFGDPKQIDVQLRLGIASKQCLESVTGHHAPEITGENVARNPQSEVTLEPQPHQYLQCFCLINAGGIDTSFCISQMRDNDIFEKLVSVIKASFISYMIVQNRQDSEDVQSYTLS